MGFEGIFLCFHKACCLHPKLASLLYIVAMQVRRDIGVWGGPIVSFDVWFTCYLEALQLPSETCVCVCLWETLLFLICVPNSKVWISSQKRSSLLHRKPYVNSFVDIPSDGGMLRAYQKNEIPWQKNPCLSMFVPVILTSRFAAHVARPCWRGTTANRSAFLWGLMVHRVRCLSASRSQSTNR